MRAFISLTGVLRTGGLLFAALTSQPLLHAQQQADRPVEKSVRVVERGAHHARIETVREVFDPFSQRTESVTNSYVQLETGLHYQDEQGRWREASEEIELLPGEAVARKGRHKARWAANINTYGAIELTTPEGDVTRSHVLGLAYYDPATGDSVMIAEIQDSTGAVAGNRVIYQDAFASVGATLQYTYTKGGFVQDVILREQLPDPGQWGFDPATVEVQVLTEFVERPEASTDPLTAPLQSAGETPAVRLGSMTMTEGSAFSIGAEETGVPVRKAFERFEGGRDILVEKVKYEVMAPALDSLPAGEPTASIQRMDGSPGRLRMAPTAPVRQWARVAPGDTTGPVRMLAAASAGDLRPGYVIDYILTGTTNNLTLQSDTTYHVTGLVTATGTITIEGGAVLKFANTNGAKLVLNGTYVCDTAPYRPAIFTGVHDNTVGVTISSTNAASTYYADTALKIDSGTADLRHLHIRHASTGIELTAGGAHQLSHVQLINCGKGLVTAGPTFHLRNALANNVLTNFHSTATATGHVEHLTANVATNLVGSGTLTLNLTNSLLVAVGHVTNIASGAGNATNSSGDGVFATAGGGQHYLAGGSAHRNAGVTNIHPGLLTDFQRMTTYPPALLSNITSDLTLSPLVARDTDLPDRGYHYQPVDYYGGLLIVTNAITLTNGVVVGLRWGTNWSQYGLLVDGAGLLKSTGTPVNPNRIVGIICAQEAAMEPIASAYSTLMVWTYSSGDADLRFTQLVMPQTTVTRSYSIGGGYGDTRLTARDSEFYGGGIGVGADNVAGVQNCLFVRSFFDFNGEDSPVSLQCQNNTFWRGKVAVWDSNGTMALKDNLFDQPSVLGLFSGPETNYIHNGFTVGTTSFLYHTNNLTNLVADFQAGPLGRYYYPTNGGSASLANLINRGSRLAGAAGLYHYTTHTNQTKELSTTVDIGYHYVAVDGNGNPIDTDGDGFADHFEDVNGNGATTPDAGETDWDNVVNQQGPGMSLVVFTPLSE